MITVIGVRLRHAGKIYYFSPGEEEFRIGENVIVETSRGIEYAEVRLTAHEVEDDQVAQPLRGVIRKATPEDTAHEKENREKEKEAFQVCKSRINERGLDMKLIYCEYTFDNSKLLFYFTSDGRVDFRELVKELAGIFRTRIELRQVGVRDETKLLGGLGSCGRPLCCTTYLCDFAPVSIKMAKEQNLSLNPIKISGVCGRLMCCLGNEEAVYEELNKKLPGVGDLVDLADGFRGEVLSVGILKQLVRVVVELPGDEKEVREYPAEDVTVRIRRKEKNRMREERENRERAERREKTERNTPEERTPEAKNPETGEKLPEKEIVSAPNRKEHRERRNSRETANTAEGKNRQKNREKADLKAAAQKGTAQKEAAPKEAAQKETVQKETEHRDAEPRKREHFRRRKQSAQKDPGKNEPAAKA